MSKEKVSKGRFGEDEAVEYLKSNGYSILERNFRIRLGELDIIAKKENRIYGIEVKYREDLSHDFHPIQMMTYHKISKMKLAMETYIVNKGNLSSVDISFCLITVDQKGKVDFYSDLSN